MLHKDNLKIMMFVKLVKLGKVHLLNSSISILPMMLMKIRSIKVQGSQSIDMTLMQSSIRMTLLGNI